VTYNVAEEVLRIALQSFEFGVLVTREIGLGSNRGTQVRTETQEFIDANALQAFEEDYNVAVGHLDGLVDLGERADFVEVRGSRIFDPWIQLGDNAQKLIVARERIDQGERALTANSERQNCSREENRIPNGQDRKSIWNKVLFISHVFSPKAKREKSPLWKD
jgi:hypothetical protein